MDNIEILKRIIQEQIPDAKSILFDFFVTFSRFECALKNTDRFLMTTKAEANWDRFASTISESFDSQKSESISKAVEYFLNEPPRKQIVRGGLLMWDENILENDMPLTNRLCVYIRRVRNNTLHGGKFNGDFKPESRNYHLIWYSLIILNEWLNLDNDVKNNFISNIEY